jgi:hypothetical protein
LFFALQNKQEWQDLKFGWPEYIDAMDRMFSRVVVTGETAYVPGVTRHLNFTSSGDEDEALPAFGTPETDGTPSSFGTPQYFDTSGSSTPRSNGSKRSASSTRSTTKKSWQEAQEHGGSDEGCQHEQLELLLSVSYTNYSQPDDGEEEL